MSPLHTRIRWANVARAAALLAALALVVLWPRLQPAAPQLPRADASPVRVTPEFGVEAAQPPAPPRPAAGRPRHSGGGERGGPGERPERVAERQRRARPRRRARAKRRPAPIRRPARVAPARAPARAAPLPPRAVAPAPRVSPRPQTRSRSRGEFTPFG